VLGITLAMSYAASLFHGASGSEHRQRRMAAHESVISVGLVAGSGLGGMIYQANGRAALFITCALVVLGTLALQAALCYWAERREKERA